MGRLWQGIARLIDSYAEGLIDKAEFEPRIARMRERLMQVEAQAQQVKDEASLERELTLILGCLDEFAARIKTELHEADWLTRREIIRALVKRVDIDQELVRVVFRVNPLPPASPLPSEKDAQSLQHCRGRGLALVSQHCVARDGRSHRRQIRLPRPTYQQTGSREVRR
jgi:site-specific DNA recombinase